MSVTIDKDSSLDPVATPASPSVASSSTPDAGPATWAWLGVHGGAGLSTLAQAVPGGAICKGGWPGPEDPGVVVLVCRTHLYGLMAALDAAQAWTGYRVGEDVLLAGVVAIADAAEDLHRPQREALTLLGGLVPHIWRVPWIPHLRVARPGTDPGVATHPALVDLASDLSTIGARTRT